MSANEINKTRATVITTIAILAVIGMIISLYFVLKPGPVTPPKTEKTLSQVEKASINSFLKDFINDASTYGLKNSDYSKDDVKKMFESSDTCTSSDKYRSKIESYLSVKNNYLEKNTILSTKDTSKWPSASCNNNIDSFYSSDLTISIPNKAEINEEETIFANVPVQFVEHADSYQYVTGGDPGSPFNGYTLVSGQENISYDIVLMSHDGKNWLVDNITSENDQMSAISIGGEKYWKPSGDYSLKVIEQTN